MGIRPINGLLKSNAEGFGNPGATGINHICNIRKLLAQYLCLWQKIWNFCEIKLVPPLTLFSWVNHIFEILT